MVALKGTKAHYSQSETAWVLYGEVLFMCDVPDSFHTIATHSWNRLLKDQNPNDSHQAKRLLQVGVDLWHSKNYINISKLLLSFLYQTCGKF